MNNKQVDRIMRVLLFLSSALVLLGAIFRLQHWPNGILMISVGVVTNLVLSSFEISRLRKIIRSYENESTES